MTNTVLTNWTDDMSAAFGKDLILAEHNLHTRPMFSDKGLIDLLDNYPREYFNLYTMSVNEETGERLFRYGSAGDLSGAEILAAVKSGLLWINLREANTHIEEYAALSDEMFGSLEHCVPGLKTFKRDAGVLISSPKARVFYHLDIPLVTLWQISGEKTFYVYPTGTPFATNEALEGIVLRESEEEIHYDPAFDQAATKVLLKPGMVANWPQTAPHRIDNGDMVNVSLSVEFQTFDAVVHANALFANGVLRRTYGRDPAIEREGRFGKLSKAALARAFKLMKARKAYERTLVPTFIIDPTAENSIRDMNLS